MMIHLKIILASYPYSEYGIVNNRNVAKATDPMIHLESLLF